MRPRFAVLFIVLPVACSSDSGIAPPMAMAPVSDSSTGTINTGMAPPAQPSAETPINDNPVDGTNTSALDPSGPPPATTGATPSSTPSTPGSEQTDSPIVTEEDDGFIVDAPEDIPMEVPDCDNILEVTYRDFSEDHEDFEMMFQGDVVRLNMIEAVLGEDGTPVFLDGLGCPPDHDDPRVCGDWEVTEISINSAESFHSWYHTVAGINHEFKKELELTETAQGSGVFVFDSTAFFPLEPEEGFGVTPRNHHQGENFLFTTEMHLLFTYVPEQVFSFSGDDDMWIFVNNKLALDLGSMHNATPGEIDFDALATELGLVPNKVYPMDIFHAERHTSASNFRIETNIGCFQPQPPRIVR